MSLTVFTQLWVLRKRLLAFYVFISATSGATNRKSEYKYTSLSQVTTNKARGHRFRPTTPLVVAHDWKRTCCYSVPLQLHVRDIKGRVGAFAWTFIIITKNHCPLKGIFFPTKNETLWSYQSIYSGIRL